MIKALSLAAALALMPLSTAAAQDEPGSAAEAAIEAAGARFEARMEEFGARAEVIAEDEALTEDQRETAIAALWVEYAPEVTAFTTALTENLDELIGFTLAEIDVEAIVAEALAEIDVDGMIAEAGAVGMAMASNGAWASQDPEHMATYGLMAEYAMGDALDAIEEVEVEVAQLNAEMAAAAVEAAAEAAADGDDD